MAFRRTTRRSFARAPRKRAIWINIPFTMSFTETAGNQLLVSPEDWEAQFTGLSMEKAVLRAVRGSLWWVQTVGGTLGTSSAFFGIYATDITNTTAPVWTVTGMGTQDWLLCQAVGVQSAVSSTNVSTQRMEINIKSKRKLTSKTALYIGGQVGVDAASPAFTVGGVLRFLVARD